MSLSAWYKGKKAKTPGPGKYDIPAPFGEGPHFTFRNRIREKEPDPEPPLRRLPSTLSKKSTTFGCRPRPREIEVTPGPYILSEPIGVDAPQYSFRFKSTEQDNENPGPGEYKVSRDIMTTAVAVKVGPRWDPVDHSIGSAPGQYDIPRTCPEPRTISIGPSIPLPKQKIYGPGPSKYYISYKMGDDTPEYTISAGVRDNTANQLPGPADYQELSDNTKDHDKIPIKLKSRTPLPHGDVCDYPYHKIPGTINAKKVSHGVRPPTKYETPSPGPVYHVPSSIQTKPITIGDKHVLPDPHSAVPGPGHYFKSQISDEIPLSFTIKGPESRYVIDEKSQSQLPGPGQYNPERTFDRPKSGFSIKSRKMDSYEADTRAPYYPTKSTLGGPKFSIGHKEDF